jgi:hypothetical protein
MTTIWFWWNATVQRWEAEIAYDTFDLEFLDLSYFVHIFCFICTAECFGTIADLFRDPRNLELSIVSQRRTSLSLPLLIFGR